jgi:nucleotide-binding universal stress UspA family protein
MTRNLMVVVVGSTADLMAVQKAAREADKRDALVHVARALARTDSNVARLVNDTREDIERMLRACDIPPTRSRIHVHVGQQSTQWLLGLARELSPDLVICTDSLRSLPLRRRLSREGYDVLIAHPPAPQIDPPHHRDEEPFFHSHTHHAAHTYREYPEPFAMGSLLIRPESICGVG